MVHSTQEQQTSTGRICVA